MQRQYINQRYYLSLATEKAPFMGDERESRSKIHSGATAYWRPAADIYQDKDKLFVLLELAGINPEELTILIYKDAIIMEGVRKLFPPSQAGVFYCAEIKQGAFRIEVPITDEVDTNALDVNYEHGLLRMCVAKFDDTLRT